MDIFTMTKRLSCRSLIIGLFFLLMLASCGFHLRLQTIAAPELKKLSITVQDNEFAYILENTLHSAGVTIDSFAPYNVHILSYSITSATQTQATSNISNYMLTATAKWTLETASGKPLFFPRTTSQSGTYQIVTDVNISSASEQQTRSHLRREIAMSIVRQIGAITSQQLKAWTLDVQHKSKKQILEQQKRQSQQKKGQAIKETVREIL